MYTLTLLPRNPLAAYVSCTFMETSRYPVVEVALNIRSEENRDMKNHNTFPTVRAGTVHLGVVATRWRFVGLGRRRACQRIPFPKAALPRDVAKRPYTWPRLATSQNLSMQ